MRFWRIRAFWQIPVLMLTGRGEETDEVSAPLARVQASVGILQDHAHPTTAKYVDKLSADVGHMSILVHELLAFFQSGVSATAGKPRRGAAIGSVLADEEGLSRALANLVRNAVRYASPEGR